MRGSRSWGWHAWGAPLAAAVAVLAVVAATVGAVRIVDSSTGRGTGSDKAATASRPPYGSVANLTQDLVDEFMTASGAQYTVAGAFLTKVVVPAENVIVIHCLAAHGYRFPPGTIVEQVAFARNATQFPDLNVIAKTGTFPGVDWVTSANTNFKQFRVPEVMIGCMLSSSNQFRAMSRYGGPLGGPFLLHEEAIQSSPQVRDTIPGLRACASKYGWPRNFEGNDVQLNSLSNFESWLESFITGPRSHGASAATMRALRRHWAPIFVECARPTVTVMEQLQLAAQRSFLASHQPQLSHLVTLAIAAFNQAGGQ